MSNGTRVAPKPFTVTIPANHPALFSLGGQAFHEAAGDLVDRVRKAAAVALIEDPATRVLMERYHEALSTTWGPGDILTKLRACGVTELHGTDYGDPGKPLSTLLRECADAMDRAEVNRLASTSAIATDCTTYVRKSAKKATTPSPAEVRRQPGLKLPIEGGKVRATESTKPVDLEIADVQPKRARQ